MKAATLDTVERPDAIAPAAGLPWSGRGAWPAAPAAEGHQMDIADPQFGPGVVDEEDAGRPGGPDVLLIERDQGVAEALAAAFSAAGFAVRLAGEGAAALSEVERAAPDLIVLDLDIPVIPGQRVLALLRSSVVGCPIPVLALATQPHRDVPGVRHAGADVVLFKPVSPDRVVSTAQILLTTAGGGIRFAA